MAEAPRPVRVLSVDGGGIRGYLPALVLAEIERRAARPAAQLFDLMVGTSTGGIIALGAAVGVSAAKLAAFYPDHGQRIFGGARSRLWGTGDTFFERMGNAGRRAGGPLGGNPTFGGNARYRPDALEAVLRTVLGQRRLSETFVETAITSFDGASESPVVFSRRDALADPGFDLPLWQVARATSAAPTFFPPFTTTWGGQARSFVDGGVWANNPSAVAVAESLHMTGSRQLTGQSVFLVSLGTGAAPAGPLFDGTQTWIGTARDTVATATSVVTGDLLARRALPPGNVRRLQVVDARIAGAMDDPSPARLQALAGAAQELIRTQSATLDEVVSRLL